MNIILKLSWICCFLQLSINCVSQAFDYTSVVQHFTTNDGLSHPYVNCMVQDTRGISWVGTRLGLNRFTQDEFKVFTTNEGLKFNNINSIICIEDILLCTHNSQKNNSLKGFSLFHTVKETLVDFETFFEQNLPFEETEIFEIEYYKTTKNLIFKVADTEEFYTIYSFSKAKGFEKTKSNIANQGREVKRYFGNPIAQHYEISADAVSYIDANQKEVFNKFFNAKLKMTSCVPIGISTTGDFWYKYYKVAHFFQIYHINKKGTFKTINIKDIVLRFYTQKQLNRYTDIKIKYNEELNAFACVMLNSFFLISADSNELLYHTYLTDKQVGRPSVLAMDTINNIFWVRVGDGFSQIALRKNHFTNYLNSKKPIPTRTILTAKDAIFFTSYDGVFKYSTMDKTVEKIHPMGLSSIYHQGGIWTTMGIGRVLQYYNTETGEKKIYPALDKNEIWALYFDNNRLWFDADKGLKYYNIETGEKGEVDYKGFEALKHCIIYHFYEKVDGNILICTDVGLYEWQLEKGIIAKYWKEGKGEFYIPSSDFRHLYFDEKDETYWFATGKDGLVHWNPTTKQSEIFTFHRQESNMLHAVYGDDFGHLWISTANGFYQFDKTTKNFRAYFRKDGICADGFNRISHHQRKDGKIYFGSKGATSFHPEDFQHTFEAKSAVKTIILEVKQYVGRIDKIKNITADYYNNGLIKMQPNDRFLSLTLALNNYAFNTDVIYYYRIKGTDETWLTTKQNEIILSGLPYGNHFLEVKASLSNGLFSSTETIDLTVLKPFYLTWWFLGLLILTIILSTFLIIQWRTKRLQLQKKELEQKVKARTQTIEQQAEELRQLDKAKSQFFANISHEFRTPITLIQAPIDTVLKTEKLKDKSQNLLNTAQRSTERLLKLVNEILDLTRLEAAKLSLEETPTVLYVFLRNIIGSFQSIADTKGIELVFIYDLRTSSKLLLDNNKLEKVLSNLLTNAFKFTPKNGRIEIKVTNSEHEKSTILIKIKDNGRGIPKADLHQVFNRFSQSSMNTKAEGGFGIGLSLSKEFIQLMNGKIWVESNTDEVNHGSTFFVEIPKKEVMTMLTNEEQILVKNDFIFPEKIPLLTNENSFDRNKKTILLVEDNYDLRAYINTILLPYYNVMTYENGQEAVEHLSTINCQLIISDVMMPIMDGFEFLEVVKFNDKWRSIPFIMLTARVELQDKLKALRIGVDDYILKPFNEAELLVRIENLLNNFQERVAFIEQESAENSLENELLTITKAEEQWLLSLEVIVIQEIKNSIFSIDYLAEELNYPRKKLYREVKRLTGLTPNQYIRTIRLKVAKDYLENQTYNTIKAVANKVGFKAVDYFSKIYQAQYGKAPSDYF